MLKTSQKPPQKIHPHPWFFMSKIAFKCISFSIKGIHVGSKVYMAGGYNSLKWEAAEQSTIQ